MSGRSIHSQARVSAAEVFASITPSGDEGRGFREWLGKLRNEDLDPSDLGSRDPEFIKAVAPFVGSVAAKYFRTEFEGVEHVPRTGPLIVVSNHNGGPMLPDLWIMLMYWVTAVGLDAPAYALAHDTAFKVPLVRNLLAKLGGLRASRENAEKVLSNGGVLLIYPGGELDSYRSFWQRNQINLHGRTGFIELAYQYGAPILPVVNIGAHEVYFTLFSSRLLARWSGIEKLTRVKTVPLTVGFPWGIWPTGFLPYVPFPSKFVYKVAPPISFPRNPQLARNPDIVRRAYVRITGIMQNMMDELASKRRFPVIG